jgi:NAD(P)-dependent dehydrogenase (short-subunit alcohol dehydrogenase family)
LRSLRQLSSLAERVALVTGARGHVGRAATDVLRELGATVALADLETQGSAHADDPDFFGVDLRDEAAARELIGAVAAKYGRLDILLHCAAYVGSTPVAGWAVPFNEQTVDAWDEALRVNLTSAFVMVQSAANFLRESSHGSVIFVSSIYGMVGPDLRLYEGTTLGNPAGYAVSKAGLNQLGRYLATALAPHVRVNTITLGGIWRQQPSEFVERYVDRTPLQRMGTEEDVKGAVAYLASDQSMYVTGHNLVVDGGWTAW